MVRNVIEKDNVTYCTFKCHFYLKVLKFMFLASQFPSHQLEQ